MTVQELIDILSGFDSDLEVRIALQPTWPLAATVEAVTEVKPDSDSDDEELDSESSVDSTSPAPIVWLAAGGMPWSESPYAPRSAWDGSC
jgi:hypothetical protein